MYSWPGRLSVYPMNNFDRWIVDMGRHVKNEKVDRTSNRINETIDSVFTERNSGFVVGQPSPQCSIKSFESQSRKKQTITLVDRIGVSFRRAFRLTLSLWRKRKIIVNGEECGHRICYNSTGESGCWHPIESNRRKWPEKLMTSCEMARKSRRFIAANVAGQRSLYQVFSFNHYYCTTFDLICNFLLHISEEWNEKKTFKNWQRTEIDNREALRWDTNGLVYLSGKFPPFVDVAERHTAQWHKINLQFVSMSFWAND